MDKRAQKRDVQEIIDHILDEAQRKSSSHFSDAVYREEPLIVTGRQMARYLPDEYRAMRRVSRWEEGADGRRGRWLSESELFYRQALLMADFEDDYPHQGSFRASTPTYSAMSDRQLRGYFTWRAAVRRGEVREAPAAFAFLYVYELLCGIGADNPDDGLRKLSDFRESARPFARGLDSHMDTWLLDYVVYHGLDPELARHGKATALDRKLLALRDARAEAEAALARVRPARGKGAGTPPLGEEAEARLLEALDGLSIAPLRGRGLYREHPRDVDHVASAVFLAVAEHCDKHRKTPYLADWFADPLELPHTMFASAVFFEPEPHPDAVVDINPIRRYRCRAGRWTCERIGGGTSCGAEVGELLDAVARRMEAAYGEAPGERDRGAGGKRMPKYLQSIIDREIAARLAWNEAHAPVVLDVDLTKLSGIRSAAALTREALLVDEEREDGRAPADGAGHPVDPDMGTPHGAAASEGPRGDRTLDETAGAQQAVDRPRPASPAAAPNATESPRGAMLEPEQADLLRALLEGREATTAGTSLDMLVDSINEALFDEIGDTVIEFGESGPRLIEDYREDVEGLI